MISAPKDIYGPNVFKQFVHELAGPAHVAKFLEVSERTVWRWLAEGSAPKMACLALYWETQYGRSLIDTDHQTELALLRGKVSLLEEQFQRAKDVVTGLKRLHFGTANEPYFDAQGEFVDEVGVPVELTVEATLSAKDQARKIALHKRDQMMGLLSNEDYTAKALRTTRRRETIAERQGNGTR